MGIPVKSSAADRRRPTLWDAAAVVCIAALAVTLAFLHVPGKAADQLWAVVTADGNTVAVLPLYPPEASEQSAFYTMEDLAYPLILEYKTGAVRVAQTTCPGRDCQHAGWIDQPGEQIICLPNRLIITMTGRIPSDFDAVTG